MAKSSAPLLLAGGAAILLFGGKKKKKNKKKGICPPVVYIEHGESIPRETLTVQREDMSEDTVILPKTAYAEAVSGNRNIIDITAKVVAPFIPESCIASTSITVKISGARGGDASIPAVEFFYRIGFEIIVDLYDAGLYSDEEAARSKNDLNKWWVDHRGLDPLPQGN